jgi:beta-galactosidase
VLDGARPWLDPGVTSISRLPIRPPLVPCPDRATAYAVLDRGPAASPWWCSLDGTWDFSLLDRTDDVTEQHLSVAPLEGTIIVPGAWTLQGHGAPQYLNVAMPFDLDPPDVPGDNPTGVYRRAVTVPRAWRGRRVVLRVGAAESAVLVHLDGAFVGMGTDSRLPSEFDLTPFVRPGRTHVLSLVLPKWSAGTWLEDQDQWWHGGLQREVTLYATAESHLATVMLVPGLAEAPSLPVAADEAVTGTLDLEATVAGPALRQEGWTVELEVRPRRGGGRALASTGRLAVPRWDGGSEGAEVLSATFVEAGVVRARLAVAGVRPWSAESPARYRAVLTLRSPAGEVVECSALDVGFRSVEVRDRALLVNGAPVRIHGVNLHEHDPRWGRWVDPVLARRDLLMVKAANFDAVRAAHYPHHERFAETCDELGILLVDEADVECHGRQSTLARDPRFAAAIVERVERMVRRDAHHPSVVLWSLGNESGDGPAIDAAAATVRRLDPSRPLHYEGALMHDLHAAAPTTDVVCPMYAPVEAIVDWSRRGADARRPLVLCEFAHAMGNSLGGLADYVDAFDRHDGLQGGFIWEWVEHGLPLPGDPSTWAYGGDFGEDRHDGNFCCDGLVDADRRPHPGLEEARFLGRPLRAALLGASPSSARVEVTSRRWSTTSADLLGEWDLALDGEVVDRGALDIEDLPPRATRRARVAWGAEARRRLRAAVRTASAPGAGPEAHLTLRWRLRRTQPWAPRGTVVGHDQFDLGAVLRTRGEHRTQGAARGRPAAPGTDRSAPGPPGAPAALVVREMSDRLEASVAAWVPTAFRALTDNDGIRTGWMRGLGGRLHRWVDDLGLDRATWSPDSAELRLPGADEDPRRAVAVRHTVVAVGAWRRLSLRFTVPPGLADLPRLGITMTLPGDLEDLEWFGHGPHDSYPDRLASVTVGRWRSGVAQQYEPYALPQEHGHHTGLRWLCLRSAVDGLLVVAEPLRRPVAGMTRPGFSARPHGDAELWQARHTSDLGPLGPDERPATHLSVDVAQRGLGTASCGPDTDPRHRIDAGRHELVLWLAGVEPARARRSRSGPPGRSGPAGSAPAKGRRLSPG